MGKGVRDDLIQELVLAVRGVSPGILRELAHRRGPAEDLVERTLAAGIADFLLTRRWRVTPPERPQPPPAGTMRAGPSSLSSGS